MFITRATRHDRDDIRQLLAAQGWTDSDLSEGVTYFARDGRVVGCVRLIEVEPQKVVVDDVLVEESRRGEGIGGDLMRAAMNAMGGVLYLCCHEELIVFYDGFGFSEVASHDLPDAVRAYLDRTGDLNPEPGHVHHFMTARKTEES
ncbi:MAG: GNAT family N-acetyltransferase [Actinomycetota bacterium]|nr:GNAT family N-acetyltransferase [Actinomycetota bacterium]